MVFGQRFVWVTDCYALKFILSYDGQNPAILCLQMRFMCWDMVVKHRNDMCLTDADYVSRLGADLCFDPLLKEYVQQVAAFRRRSPAPKELSIAPKHQPYFHGPRLNMPRMTAPTTSARYAHNLDATTALIMTGLQHLSNWRSILEQRPQQILHEMPHRAAFTTPISHRLQACCSLSIGPSTTLTADTYCPQSVITVSFSRLFWHATLFFTVVHYFMSSLSVRPS
jgi:hypothetical protein